MRRKNQFLKQRQTIHLNPSFYLISLRITVGFRHRTGLKFFFYVPRIFSLLYKMLFLGPLGPLVLALVLRGWIF